MIFFNLLSLRLSSSHYSSRRFCGVTWVDSGCFLFFFKWFIFSIPSQKHLVYWELDFDIYFNMLSLGYYDIMIRVMNLAGWPRPIQFVFFFIFFLKKSCFEFFLKSNYIFTSCPTYFWTCQINRVILGQPHTFFFFLKKIYYFLEKNYLTCNMA
jgi:hypothetical protein